jgi:hypothetical protein
MFFPPISTRVELPRVANWDPLIAFARECRESEVLPSFHHGEFMHMGVASAPPTRIHLYKHRDTRRYLNLDECGNAYEYCGPAFDDDDPMSAGEYRLHEFIEDAIDRADLHVFETEPGFFRSYPPSDWPPEAS